MKITQDIIVGCITLLSVESNRMKEDRSWVRGHIACITVVWLAQTLQAWVASILRPWFNKQLLFSTFNSVEEGYWERENV